MEERRKDKVTGSIYSFSPLSLVSLVISFANANIEMDVDALAKRISVPGNTFFTSKNLFVHCILYMSFPVFYQKLKVEVLH